MKDFLCRSTSAQRDDGAGHVPFAFLSAFNAVFWTAFCDHNLGKFSVDIEKITAQVFYGCTRYQKFLRLFVNSFLYKNPSMAQRSDQTLYMILGYLLFFRLTELGMQEYNLMV